MRLPNEGRWRGLGRVGEEEEEEEVGGGWWWSGLCYKGMVMMLETSAIGNDGRGLKERIVSLLFDDDGQ